MPVYHKIKAQLYDNALTDNPNDYIARVVSEKSLNVRDIAQSTMIRGGANVSADSIEHAVNLFLKEMSYCLCDGFSINTGYFTAQASLKGVFHSANEEFNREKHSVSFDFHQGSLLRKELENVEIDIVGLADASCSITQVIDVKTGSINEFLTPNRNLKISGSKIKIAGDKESNGVYFVNQETNERIKVDTSDIVTNNPSKLIVVIPALSAGSYQLEVATQFSGSGGITIKEARSAMFDKPLTVIG
jgi:nucleoid DNA-binding protein